MYADQGSRAHSHSKFKTFKAKVQIVLTPVESDAAEASWFHS